MLHDTTRNMLLPPLLFDIRCIGYSCVSQRTFTTERTRERERESLVSMSPLSTLLRVLTSEASDVNANCAKIELVLESTKYSEDTR